MTASNRDDCVPEHPKCTVEAATKKVAPFHGGGVNEHCRIVGHALVSPTHATVQEAA
jgi:hypothetical protein